MKPMNIRTRACLAWAALSISAAPAGGQSAADTVDFAGAVQAALSSDPRLAAASARLGQAEAARAATAAARLPLVTSSALVVRHGEPMIVAPLHRLDLAHLPDFDPTLVQARVRASQLLYDGGALSSRVRGARGAEDAARASIDDVRAAVLEDLADAYLTLLSARDVLTAQRERTVDLAAELDRASQLFDEGASPRLALLRASSELSAARADVEGAEARVELAEATLALRMGVARGALTARPLRELALPASAAGPSPRASTDPPAVAAARARAASATARVEEALAARRPRLLATGALEEYGGGHTSFSTELQGGLQVEYPVFNGGATGRAVELARAELRHAEAELSEVERMLAEAAEAASAARTEALARAAALGDRVTTLEELVRVERLALEEGAGVQRDFLDAAASLAEARAGLAQARRAAVRAEIRLARVTGHLTPEWLSGRVGAAR